MPELQPSELAAAFAAEVLLAVEATRPLGDAAGLRVESIRVDATAVAVPGTTTAPWRVEVGFVRDGGRRVEITGTEAADTLDLLGGGAWFSARPTTAIQGIDHRRHQKLSKAGIETIGDLAAIDDAGLTQLSRELRFPSLIEYRTKATLVQASLPRIPASAADETSLYDLARMSPAQLQSKVGDLRFNAPSATILCDYLRMLTVCIDAAVLRRMMLGEFRRALEEQS